MYNEREVAKKEIENKYLELNDNINTGLRNLRTKFQTDLGACVNRIKTTNAEFINQARKINLINSQPITNMTNSNYYTETDSNDKKNEPIKYLSDVDTVNNKLSNQNILSDKLKNSKKSNSIKSDNFNITELSKHNTEDNTKIDFSKYIVHSSENKKLYKEDIKEKIKQNKNNISDEKKTNFETDTNRLVELLANSDINDNNSISEHINIDINQFNSNNKDIDNLLFQKNKLDIDPIDLSHKKDSINEKEDSSNEKEDSINEKEDSINEKEDSSDEKEDNSDEKEDSSDEKEDSINEKEDSINEKEDSINEKEDSEFIASLPNKDFGEITIGSKKGDKGKKLSLNIKNDDNNSIATNDIPKLNIKNLKILDDYTKKNLEKIAKVHCVPISYKSTEGKRIQYKKDELYEKIKQFIVSNEKLKQR